MFVMYHQSLKLRLSSRLCMLGCKNVATDMRSGKTGHWFKLLQKTYKSDKELAQHILENIVYKDDNILVINKPNGLPMHKMEYSKDTSSRVAPNPSSEYNWSVISAIERIQSDMQLPYTAIAYAQPRLHSGLAVFALNEKAALKLRKYFVTGRIHKKPIDKYLAVGLGIPKEQTGTSSFFLSQHELSPWTLSVVLDKASRRARDKRTVIKADMSYEVLDVNERLGCCLMQVSPSTLKWDSLQMFMLHQLCPVLGDHHYACRLTKVMDSPVFRDPNTSYPEPQKIEKSVCTALGLSLTPSNLVPLHVHCWQLTLPDVKSRTLFTLTAPLPTFFCRTLECLDLHLPGGSSTLDNNIMEEQS